jgi:hypothetical protein
MKGKTWVGGVREQGGRKIFERKREQGTGDCRKVLNEKPRVVYSPNTSRVIKLRRVGWTDLWHAWGRREGHVGFLVWKPELKRPFGRRRRSWVDNIKTDLKGIDREVVDWYDLTEDRHKGRAVVYTLVNLRFACTSRSVGCVLIG